MAASTYTTVLAPIAEAQIDAALLWWARHRAAAREVLAREIEAAIETIEQVPQSGDEREAGCFATSVGYFYV